MLSRKIRVLNFDDSVTRQKRLREQYSPAVIDLTHVGPSCRIWLNKKNSEVIKESLNVQEKNSVTFLGSGDFHHISGLLLEQFAEPLTIIVFDYHPDWDILPPRLGYGSWVTYALRNPNIKKIILLGVSSHDISTFSIQTGNLAALTDNRVEIYPYRHCPTTTFFKKVPGHSASIRVEDKLFYKKIHWQELRNADLTKFFLALKERIDARQVYVSVDKDCLRAPYSLTNWEEGCFELDDVLLLLGLIKKHLDIVGLDITGDYSLPKINGKFMEFLYQTDHPKIFSAQGRAEAEINSVNEATNLEILGLLGQA
jgi:hypothetical protein